MNQDYIPGEECQCSAYNESECGCGADWTPREVYELRDKAERYRLEANSLMMQRDRLAAIARELTAMIRVNVMWGRFAECSVEQIDEHLKPWNEKIAAVEGGSHDN
jgi:hypothetical protein